MLHSSRIYELPKWEVFRGLFGWKSDNLNHFIICGLEGKKKR